MNNSKLWIALAIAYGILLGQGASADHIAYSFGKSGKAPLPERIDSIDAKHLLNLEWGEYTLRKARLRILKVDNNSTAGSFTVSSGSKGAEGSIGQAGASQIYTNLGQDAVSVGDRLQVVRKGEELIDPDTGISLGGSMTSLGEIEVTQVQEKFSIARPLSLNGTPERSDKVLATTVAAPLEFADAWKEPKQVRYTSVLRINPTQWGYFASG